MCELFSNPSYLSGLLGALIGAGASILATVIANRSNRKAQIEKKRLDLRMSLLEEDEANLVELQDTLQEWTRAMAVNYMEVATGDRVAENGLFLASDEASERTRALGSKLYLLTSRVQDDSLRKGLDDIRCRQCLSNDKSTIMVFIGNLSDDVAKMQEKLGVMIRSSRAELVGFANGGDTKGTE